MPAHHVIQVTSGPTAPDRAEASYIASLSVVKTELGISGSGSDTKLTRLIAAASSLFAGAQGLQRPYHRQTYQESLPGYGGLYLPLSRWPIESVTSITEGGSTITASDYSIADPERSKIYRADGWAKTSINTPIGGSGTGDEELDYVATYVAGWVMPGNIADWAASTAYVVGDFVRSSDIDDLVLFECTTAGTSDASEPTWDTTAGNTTTDNSVTWTARNAREFPGDLQEAAIVTVIDWFRGGLQVPTGIQSESVDGMRIAYRDPGTVMAAPPFALQVVKNYR